MSPHGPVGTVAETSLRWTWSNRPSRRNHWKANALWTSWPAHRYNDLIVSSREYPADADIQGNPSSFTRRSDLSKQFMMVRARPAFSPFQADDASSILVGRSHVSSWSRRRCFAGRMLTGNRTHPTPQTDHSSGGQCDGAPPTRLSEPTSEAPSSRALRHRLRWRHPAPRTRAGRSGRRGYSSGHPDHELLRAPTSRGGKSIAPNRLSGWTQSHAHCCSRVPYRRAGALDLHNCMEPRFECRGSSSA